MKLYDIDYNLIDDEKLEDTFHNADDLRKINMPLKIKRDDRCQTIEGLYRFLACSVYTGVGDDMSPTSAGTDGSGQA